MTPREYQALKDRQLKVPKNYRGQRGYYPTPRRKKDPINSTISFSSSSNEQSNYSLKKEMEDFLKQFNM